MKFFYLFFAALPAMLFTGCETKTNKDFVKDNFDFAGTQLSNILKEVQPQDDKFPRTIDKEGKLVAPGIYEWTTGFFPGNLWYTYEYSQDKRFKDEAIKWTEQLKPLETFTKHHDLGFMMYCSYGNAYRLTGDESYRQILINSAKSLSTRFNPVTGCIKSWERFKSWHGDSTYYFPVIIDNMMNLELLFFASKVTGDTSFRNIAVTHATTTMNNHFRPDYSSYHVVCYDSTTGKVIARETAQGYADNSTWSRGQAWAIYGFTMTYRETKDSRFLNTAKGLADYYINSPALPADKIALWDFNANQEGYTPGVNSNANKVTEKYRDASAAAVTASALLELSTYTEGEASEKYKDVAIKILQSLGSAAYRAKPGANGNFILEHSVGSIPHNVEIDVPLVYADYYFLEGLLRYHRLQDGKALF